MPIDEITSVKKKRFQGQIPHDSTQHHCLLSHPFRQCHLRRPSGSSFFLRRESKDLDPDTLWFDPDIKNELSEYYQLKIHFTES